MYFSARGILCDSRQMKKKGANQLIMRATGAYDHVFYFCPYGTSRRTTELCLNTLRVRQCNFKVSGFYLKARRLQHSCPERQCKQAANNYV